MNHALGRKLEYPNRLLQECPFCKEKQPILVKGVVCNPEQLNVRATVEDKGYSFCNCKNILYTDWNNIEQSIYDKDYFDRYDKPEMDKYMDAVTFDYGNKLLSYNKKAKYIVEIGSINNYLLDFMERKGLVALGIDINPFADPRRRIQADIEDGVSLKKVLNPDLIYASHVWEHLHYPLNALQNCYDILAKDGCMYIAMPDPFFINWYNVYDWGHWVIREHHIMWDMDSFIKEAEKIGFKCVEKRRNHVGQYLCIKEFHIILQK